MAITLALTKRIHNIHFSFIQQLSVQRINTIAAVTRICYYVDNNDNLKNIVVHTLHPLTSQSEGDYDENDDNIRSKVRMLEA